MDEGVCAIRPGIDLDLDEPPDPVAAAGAERQRTQSPLATLLQPLPAAPDSGEVGHGAAAP
ncbi:hypothetical protein [Pseudonocardia asaccharolytica]|uniref:Uncharacterized protein n=1 Tax=Pseudonocardia asaccharolytica DSM 44247 = NBRC 16224 TaxID=1123024 RepID=A0A511D4B9_9PSEU|nr:hypothetical protein [Pseudonocardia asaccharolytica]GEL19507.1 hypothetical protein PA7_33440 [Pseudonocardia asaccharolytica DSM 44247 = NBRC 16224]